MCQLSTTSAFVLLKKDMRVYKVMFNAPEEDAAISYYQKFSFSLTKTYKVELDHIIINIKRNARTWIEGSATYSYTHRIFYGFHAFTRKRDAQRIVRNNGEGTVYVATIPAGSYINRGKWADIYTIPSIVSDSIRIDSKLNTDKNESND